MNYTGVIIGESLQNISILQEVKILRTTIEQTTLKHKTPWVKQWTLHTVEIQEDIGDIIAEKLSKDLDKLHSWYADYKNDEFHFIIFKDKIFKVDLSNPSLYKDVKQYGISLGIPEYQVNFI